MGGASRMIDDIEAEVAFTRHMIGKNALDARVMEAMRRVPREEFVPQSLRSRAFANGPLPIGHGQTISQPYIVALMTDLVHPKADATILEVGTGSGYQAAVLSLLVRQVYSVEVIPTLAEEASARLRRLGFLNVAVRAGDAYAGWQDHAPFDGILVTAAAPEVPPPLLEQLKPGGHMVIPVGPAFGHQELLLIEKDERGRVHEKSMLGVAFVPFRHAPDTA